MIGEAQMLDRFERARRLRDGEWLVTCPAHDDRNPSLHVTLAEDRWLLKCQAGCETPDVLDRAGLEWSDLFAENGNGHADEEAVYRYLDEQGKPLFEVVRFTGKQFRQRLPDGSWGLNGARRVLYRLPRVLEAVARGEDVMVPEGEKDVDALEKLGIAATCNPGGAGKWRDEYSESLRGAKVTIVSDRDDPGRAHARQVAESLRGVASEVDVVEPTKGKDITEHFANGGTIAGLVEVDGFFSFVSPPRDEKKEKNPEEAALGSTEPNVPFAAPMSEKLAGVPPEPNWLWDGYLTPGALTLLAGRPKVGKTTLLFPLIAALEQGRPFLDRPTMAARVLMLSEEREQTLAEKRQLYLDGADPLLLMRHEQGGRSWPELVEQARSYCAQNDIGVLVVDTWDKWTGLRGDDGGDRGARAAHARRRRRARGVDRRPPAQGGRKARRSGQGLERDHRRGRRDRRARTGAGGARPAHAGAAGGVALHRYAGRACGRTDGRQRVRRSGRARGGEAGGRRRGDRTARRGGARIDDRGAGRGVGQRPCDDGAQAQGRPPGRLCRPPGLRP
jgi:5S rRNA maturation endonuclease (ribonuclease M5)